MRARLREQMTTKIRLLSLEVAEPGGAAPVITLETSEPEGLFGEDWRKLTFVGELDPYEGYLIRLVDQRGELVWIKASASRAGAGMGWTRPDLQGEM